LPLIFGLVQGILVGPYKSICSPSVTLSLILEIVDIRGSDLANGPVTLLH
jgi:hypothetical protein